MSENDGHHDGCHFQAWRDAGSPRPPGRPHYLGPGCTCGYGSRIADRMTAAPTGPDPRTDAAVGR